MSYTSKTLWNRFKSNNLLILLVCECECVCFFYNVHIVSSITSQRMNTFIEMYIHKIEFRYRIWNNSFCGWSLMNGVGGSGGNIQIINLVFLWILLKTTSSFRHSPRQVTTFSHTFVWTKFNQCQVNVANGYS